MEFTAVERDAVRSWNRYMDHEVPLVLRRTADPRSETLRDFLETLMSLADRVRGGVLEEKEMPGLPAFLIGGAWRYHGLPRAMELRPFLDLLAFQVESPAQAWPESLRVAALGVENPATLKVFVTPQCPHCPRVVQDLAPLPFLNPKVQVVLVDGELFPEEAREYGIRAVPAVVLNEYFRWTGPVRVAEVLEALARREGSDMSPEAMVRMLKEGNAEGLARLMIAAGRVFPGFVEVISHPEWSVRLGGLVLAEELVSKMPQGFGEILSALWDRMYEWPEAVQGDILYLTGLNGDPEWVGEIQSFLEGRNVSADLVEVGREALEALLGRTSPV